MCFNVAVRAGELGIRRAYNDERGHWEDVDGSGLIWPCFEGLAMGWWWAVWVVMN